MPHPTGPSGTARIAAPPAPDTRPLPRPCLSRHVAVASLVFRYPHPALPPRHCHCPAAVVATTGVSRRCCLRAAHVVHWTTPHPTLGLVDGSGLFVAANAVARTPLSPPADTYLYTLPTTPHYPLPPHVSLPHPHPNAAAPRTRAPTAPLHTRTPAVAGPPILLADSTAQFYRTHLPRATCTHLTPPHTPHPVWFFIRSPLFPQHGRCAIIGCCDTPNVPSSGFTHSPLTFWTSLFAPYGLVPADAIIVGHYPAPACPPHPSSTWLPTTPASIATRSKQRCPKTPYPVVRCTFTERGVTGITAYLRRIAARALPPGCLQRCGWFFVGFAVTPTYVSSHRPAG